MIIHRYGITLTPVSEKNKELVRLWRNAEHVRTGMIHQEMISKKEHEQWFDRLNPEKDLYFIFSSGSEDMGVVNLKNIDVENKTAEAGIFTGNKEYLDTPQPVYTVLALMDLAFFYLGMETLFATILHSNENAVKFNHALGYMPLPQNGHTDYSRYAVSKNTYLAKAGKLRKTAIQLYGNRTEIDHITKKTEILKWD